MIRDVPVGYLLTTLLLAWLTWWAVAPLRTTRVLAFLSFYSGFILNEVPFLAAAWLLGSTMLVFAQGDIRSPAGWVGVGIAAATLIGLAIVAWRGARAIPELRRALAEGTGESAAEEVSVSAGPELRPSFRSAALLGPFFRRRRDVVRVADIRYGESGTMNLLDLYHHRAPRENAPVFIHLHGGAFVSGTKDREALPLIYRLAGRGWVCISANYGLRPAASFADSLTDVKRVIAWVREHGAEFGADPSAIFLSGGSAGGTLAAQAALTVGDPTFQPGFEDADTSVTAAIPLYAWFGWIQHRSAQSLSADGRAVPPFLLVHGDKDSLCRVEDARRFARELRCISENPVVYAELPGAQHAFDVLHSIRSEAVADAIEVFAARILATHPATPG